MLDQAHEQDATELADWLESITGKPWSVRWVHDGHGRDFYLATGQGLPLTAETVEDARNNWPLLLKRHGWIE